MPSVKRLLIPSAALLWGLHLAFLNPVLALLLVALYDATPGEVGWVLGIYNASGFVFSLVLPSYADRKGQYLRLLLLCGALTLFLAAALAATSSLPLALIALVLLGGPAGVASSVLFAHLKHSGARPADVMNTRAIVSVAWVAGPPLATLIIGWFGDRSILIALAAVALLNITVTAVMLRQDGRHQPAEPLKRSGEDDQPVSRLTLGVIMVAFIALQATNTAVVSVMSLYVTETLGLRIMWAGIALGVAAGLEIPALMIMARLSDRYSNLTLIASGCVAGVAYYTAAVFVSGPVTLLALQVLNAWFVAVVAGVGLTLFQQVMARPGLASGLYANTRRLGAIVSGPLVGLGGWSALGFGAVFVACAALTVIALVLVIIVGRTTKRSARRRE